MKSRRLLMAMLVVGLAMILLPLVVMADPGRSPSQDKPECNPRSRILAKWMDLECQDLMDYQADGVGFGVMMKAYLLSQVFADLEWQALVESHISEEGLGWGQVMKAYFLASVLGPPDVDAEDLLELRREGVGWGEIKKSYRDGPGRPPWAGGGPRPWAQRSRPPWAGPYGTEE